MEGRTVAGFTADTYTNTYFKEISHAEPDGLKSFPGRLFGVFPSHPMGVGGAGGSHFVAGGLSR
jgi:hypothetical protein